MKKNNTSYTLTQDDIRILQQNPWMWEGMGDSLESTSGSGWLIKDILGPHARPNKNVQVITDGSGKKILSWRGYRFVIPQDSNLYNELGPNLVANQENRTREANLRKKEVVEAGPITGGKVVDETISIKPKKINTVTPQDNEPQKLPPRPEPVVVDSTTTNINNDGETVPDREDREYIPQTRRNDEDMIPQSRRDYYAGGTVESFRRRRGMGYNPDAYYSRRGGVNEGWGLRTNEMSDVQRDNRRQVSAEHDRKRGTTRTYDDQNRLVRTNKRGKVVGGTREQRLARNRKNAQQNQNTGLTIPNESIQQKNVPTVGKTRKTEATRKPLGGDEKVYQGGTLDEVTVTAKRPVPNPDKRSYWVGGKQITKEEHDKLTAGSKPKPRSEWVTASSPDKSYKNITKDMSDADRKRFYPNVKPDKEGERQAKKGAIVKPNKNNETMKNKTKPRKLSRFERRFKKAREKGKETFKYRKRRFDLTEKRGVYHTGLKTEEGGKKPADKEERRADTIPNDGDRGKEGTKRPVDIGTGGQGTGTDYDDGGVTKGNYGGGSDTPQVVRDKEITYDRSWIRKPKKQSSSNNDTNDSNETNDTNVTNDSQQTEKLTKQEKFYRRQQRREEREANRLKKKEERLARRKYRKEARQYRRTMRRKARQERREAAGHKFTGGRRISPRRWWKNLRDKLGIGAPGRGNLRDWDSPTSFPTTRKEMPVRTYKDGGKPKSAQYMSYDDMVKDPKYQKASKSKDYSNFTYWEETQGYPGGPKTKQVMNKEFNPKMKPSNMKGGGKVAKRKYLGGGKVKKYSNGGNIPDMTKKNLTMSDYKKFLDARDRDAANLKRINEYNVKNKVDGKTTRKMVDSKNLKPGDSWKQSWKSPKKPNNKQLVRMLMKKGGRTLLKRLGWLGAAITAAQGLGIIYEGRKNLMPSLKDRAEKNPNFGRKI
tara:strand:+ start:4237 stop:7041 length:2805 start_codon:yes stop_codon:yes gene_type:complete